MTKAIILLSGGLDSAVVLGLALAQERTCYTISFDYGQRHIIELEAAKKIAAYYRVNHKIIKIDPSSFGMSSLLASETHSLELKMPMDRTVNEMKQQGIPNTYVPARNTLFLAYALGQCELHGAQEIHFGANKMDRAGYADCRPAFLEAFQSLMKVATKQSVESVAPRLITPLIEWDKTEIIRQGQALGVPLNMTFSCYNPQETLPCERCDACVLRKNGFTHSHS